MIIHASQKTLFTCSAQGLHSVLAIADFHVLSRGDKAGRTACFRLPAQIMNWRRQRSRGHLKDDQQPCLNRPECRLPWTSCLSRATCSRLQATAWLQLDFLTDGQFNEPIYRGSFNIAITPINLFAAGLE